jgi:hypothetical protein
MMIETPRLGSMSFLHGERKVLRLLKGRESGWVLWLTVCRGERGNRGGASAVLTGAPHFFVNFVEGEGNMKNNFPLCLDFKIGMNFELQILEDK